MVISKKTIFFNDFRGGQLFSRGEGNFFHGGGGGLMGNFYRNPYNL